MAPRTVYANLQDGLQPFSLFDQSLADMGNLGVIPCTAAGTNAIVLTPLASAFTPNISNPPQQLQNFTFVAAATSTGPITVNGLKLYKEDGVTQATTGDLVINVLYGIAFNSALNSAAGGYQIVFPVTSIINPVISGATISNSTITTSTYNGNTWTAGTGILTIAALKTLTANNTLTLAGTDGTTMTFPTTSATLARTDAANTFTGHQTIEGVTSTGATGTGNLVFSISPTFTGTASFAALTATTLNGNTFTTGTYTLTGVAAKTLTFSNSLTLAGTDATTITFQATDTYVGRATTDTLTNKTFDTAGAGNVFKINGTQISAVTGTGSAVLATSPTIPTLSGDTAITGFINTAGYTRVTSDFSVTSSTVLVNVTGLSVTVVSGKNYSFEAYLTCTDAAANGVKAAIAGTATATNIIYDGYVLDTNAIKGQTNATALATAVASTLTTATDGIIIKIQGTITVNAGGTLTVQFAQSSSGPTASVVKQGSFFKVWQVS